MQPPVTCLWNDGRIAAGREYQEGTREGRCKLVGVVLRDTMDTEAGMRSSHLPHVIPLLV